jgi:hypothetical protein
MTKAFTTVALAADDRAGLREVLVERGLLSEPTKAP